MKINIQDIQKLRKKTGARIIDCKNSLIKCNGNIKKAIELLEIKGFTNYNENEENNDKININGVISISIDKLKKKASIIELNSETDFVEKNNKFQKTAMKIADSILNYKKENEININEILECKYINNKKNNITIRNVITKMKNTFNEKITLRRISKITVNNNNIIGHYIHNTYKYNTGKIGTIVILESKIQNEKIKKLAKDLAMHITAFKPVTINIANLNTYIKNKTLILQKKIKNNRINTKQNKNCIKNELLKNYSKIILLEQKFLFNNEKKVSLIIREIKNEIKENIKIIKFIRYQVGENIDK